MLLQSMAASAHLLNFLKSRLPNFRDGNDMLVVQRLGGYACDNFYSEILCLAHYCRSKRRLARSAKDCDQSTNQMGDFTVKRQGHRTFT